MLLDQFPHSQTSIYWVWAIAGEQIERSRVFGALIGTLSVCYLGLPLMWGQLRTMDWQ